eukprot:TRINITY_DN22_c1_g3_i1.p2 TRINITY_DN22_c1_g3~~TRINITY_DN22_c1_g3_i1.p2  ORF type:complete len:274 (+),score=124.86 TRINITY_DN22_c1_g3_i1:130-951(+)
MPGQYSDHSKKANDLLNKEFTTDTKAKIESGKGNSKVTSNLVRNAKGIKADIEIKQPIHDVDTTLKINGNGVFSLSLKRSLVDGLKVTAKVEGSNTRTIKAEYSNATVNANSTIDLSGAPKVSLDANVPVSFCPGLSAGFEAGYATDGGLTKANAGAQYAFGNGAVLTAAVNNSGGAFAVTYYQALGSLNANIATRATFNRADKSTKLDVGIERRLDGVNTIKGRVNQGGDVGLALIHKLSRNSSVTISSQFAGADLAKLDSHSLGLSFTFTD